MQHEQMSPGWFRLAMLHVIMVQIITIHINSIQFHLPKSPNCIQQLFQVPHVSPMFFASQKTCCPLSSASANFGSKGSLGTPGVADFYQNNWLVENDFQTWVIKCPH